MSHRLEERAVVVISDLKEREILRTDRVKVGFQLKMGGERRIAFLRIRNTV